MAPRQHPHGNLLLKRAEPPAAAAIAVQHPHRFVTLDLLRGVAAVGVVYYHTHELFGSGLYERGFFQHAYLAVDFFFMLSGFVIASAYGKRLDTGWPTFTLMKARFARLYPLYLFALVLAFAFTTFLHSQHGQPGIHAGTLHIFLLGLVLLPALWGPGPVTEPLFPLNTPAWSLFYELFANLFHAFALRRRSTRSLSTVVAPAAVALTACVLHRNTGDFGHDRQTFLYGFVRVVFSYTVGVLTFKLWSRGVGRFRWPAAGSVLLLACLLVCPVPPSLAGLYDLAATVLLFPLLLLLSASAVPPRFLIGTSILLGNASYALYVLHVPASPPLQALARAIAGRELHTPWRGVVNLLALLALSLLLDRFYDFPARAFLRKTLHA